MYANQTEKRWARFFFSLGLHATYQIGHDNQKPAFFIAANGYALWFHTQEQRDPEITRRMVEFSRANFTLVGLITGQPWPGKYNILMTGWRDGSYGITADPKTQLPLRCIFGYSDCKNVSVDIYVRPVEAARALVSPIFITNHPCSHRTCHHYILMDEGNFEGEPTPLHHAYREAAKS